MDRSSNQYFWVLDSTLSQSEVKSLKKSLDSQNTAEMQQWLGLLEANVPMPPRVYLSSHLIRLANQKLPAEVLDELGEVIHRLEQGSGMRFGGKNKPLLMTVKGDYSGAVRNIGCSRETLPALVHQCGEAAAFSLYVDFLETYSKLVLGAEHLDFRKTFGIQSDRSHGIDHLKNESLSSFLDKVKDYQNLISQKTGRPFTDRIENHLLSTLLYAAKTAANLGGDEISIQVQMHRSLFGKSVHGLVYTRNPYQGGRDVYGLYQMGTDGKKKLLDGSVHGASPDDSKFALRTQFPEIYSEVTRYLPLIEATSKCVMEVQFVTDEDGHLHFTQFDMAEVTSRAAVLSTMDLNREGILSDQEAALRLKPADVESLLHPALDDESKKMLKSVGSAGVAAAPGTAVGHVFFKMQDAIQFHQDASRNKGDKRVILIADELLISDTPGLGLIQGLVTKASGIASHAAVMARANGIPCIVGYKGLELDPEGRFCKVNGQTIEKGALVTLEAGSEGLLYFGEGRLSNLSFKEGVIRDVSQLVTRVLRQKQVPLEVRVNINNSKDAEVGLVFGADGVGLCRTENMFMAPESLREIRNIVFSQDIQRCKDSIKTLEEIQFRDFKKIFEIMREKVVNIRLMDLPLHDFVPQTAKDFETLSQQLPHLSLDHLRSVADRLREHNPMLGLRACRFGLINPEVYELQIRAIVKAAYSCVQEKIPVNPGIMFPLVFLEAELAQLRNRVLEIEEEVRAELKVPLESKIRFRVGSMIELPAAALSADQLSRVGEFFAFGTNDLTQTTLGMSRDDSAHYLPHYLEKGLLKSDPFKVLSDPVRELIELAVKRGRRVRLDGSFGICGEQGGDISSLLFCLEKSLNYVSCSPFRVLPTRLSLLKVALSSFTSAGTDGSDTPSASYKDGSGPSPKLARAG